MPAKTVMKLYHGKRVVLEDGLQEAGLLVGDTGTIEKVFRSSELTSLLQSNHSYQVEDVGYLVLMPGLVDSHVHINEPGYTHWEGFWTATRAAAAGGITTIVDMPLNSVPYTTSVKHLKTKMEAAKDKIHVDVAFWGGLQPNNQDELLGMVNAGVVGFKGFLIAPQDEFKHVTKEDVERAMQTLQGSETVLAFHAELDLGEKYISVQDNPFEYLTYLRTCPHEMEIQAIQLVADLCLKHNIRCHIVHLSACEALPTIYTAKKKGARISAETCHHYLTFTSELIPDGAVEYKCCPPIRNLQNRERLWAALASGEIDLVTSDHSPCPPEDKQPGTGHFLSAWGGVSSLQFGLSVFWTEARKRSFAIADVARLLSQNPAKLCSLQHTKGLLKEGMDADFVIWDPEATFKVEESMIQHKHKLTPYLGMQLDGQVVKTIVRGTTVFQDGNFSSPKGKLILSALKKK